MNAYFYNQILFQLELLSFTGISESDCPSLAECSQLPWCSSVALADQFCRINDDEYFVGYERVQIDYNTFKYMATYEYPHAYTKCRFEEEETLTEDEQRFSVSKTFLGNVNTN